MNNRSHSRKLPHVIPDYDDDVPFDEDAKHKHRPLHLHPKACLRAFGVIPRVHPKDAVSVSSSPLSKRMAMANSAKQMVAANGSSHGNYTTLLEAARLTHSPTPSSSSLRTPLLPPPPQAHNHDEDCKAPDECFPCGSVGENITCGASSVEDIAMMTCRAMEDLGGCAPPPPPLLLQTTQVTLSRSSSSSHSYHYSVVRIGPPQYSVFKTRIPDALMPLLPPIVSHAESHASARHHGWETNLYSLTKQDVPLADVPGGMTLAQPLTDFVVWSLQQLYATSSSSSTHRPPTVRMDGNQPHVLKYDVYHSGVPLHHDKCDVTAQLLLSHSNSYVGGGTYFSDFDATVRLERGELLFHPGSLVHAGRNVTSGSRLLLVWFIHLR